MSSGNDDKLDSTNVDLLKADERYHFKLSDILRKRNRPLLMMIDKNCNLKSSSVPAEGSEMELRLIELALQEVKALFESEFKTEQNVRRLIVEKPGERCALVILDRQLFSLRIFPFFGPGKDQVPDLFALLVEPVMKPVTDGIEFDKVREQFGLSKRETDVLKALMSGETDKVLAKDLGLSVETVRAYLKSVRLKLDVSTRTAVVHRVHEMFENDSSGRN
jgi:DNA-binding CsgD family transcriptional regulator